VITADALDCQKETARIIVDRGGEYCIQVKDNQKAIRQEAELSAKELGPLLPKPKKRTGESTGVRKKGSVRLIRNPVSRFHQIILSCNHPARTVPPPSVSRKIPQSRVSLKIAS